MDDSSQCLDAALFHVCGRFLVAFRCCLPNIFHHEWKNAGQNHEKSDYSID
jgi:hypothetical protein